MDVRGNVGFEELRTAWQQRRRDPVAALRVAEEVRDTATAEGDEVLRGRALTVEGACHLLRNDFAPALHCLLEAVTLLEQGPVSDRAQALSELGHLEAVLGDMAAGMEHLTDALRLYEELDDQAGVASTLNRLGVGFFSDGELSEAQHAYERCLAIHERLDDVVATAGVRNNLAKVATARGNLDEAERHLTMARVTFEAEQEWRGVAMTEHNLGLVHREAGQVDAAVTRLRTAIEHYVRSGHLHGAIEARIDLGRLLVARDSGSAEAQAMFERANDDAEKLGFPGEAAQAVEALADLHEARGEAATALRWLRRLRELERHLFDTESDQRLRALQVRFNLDRLERDSVTDALTGLLNRRGLDLALTEAVDRRREHGEPVAVVMLDLDDFKQVNDQYTHAVGDAVLQRVADLLREVVRPTDACARFGGEEFAVVLPGCDLARATTLAEDVCARLDTTELWSDIVDGLRVTASIGVATLGASANGAALLAAADRALYAAKHGGKNRVHAMA